MKRKLVHIFLVLLGFLPLISFGMNSDHTVQSLYSVAVESSAEPEQDSVFLPTENDTPALLFDNLNTCYFITNECIQGDETEDLQSPPPEIN
ncbi:MAG: hypothetical protein JXR71_11955 [Bacteroidales bacterium]|nr:hypothetical protein [Bacteroidales bacterium]